MSAYLTEIPLLCYITRRMNGHYIFYSTINCIVTSLSQKSSCAYQNIRQIFGIRIQH